MVAGYNIDSSLQDLAVPDTPKPDVADIAEHITAAIMEHRLSPGGKLAEEKLAAAFGVSRTKIRQALTTLSKDGLVRLHPNRGAFVTRPSVQEARDLFATRRLLEPEIIRNVIAHASADDIRRLHEHLAAEDAMRSRGERRALIKLTGEFHMLLAELAGNAFISKLMNELCPFTCLIIALYDSPKTATCPDHEHAEIVRAIEERRTDDAIRIMLAHLDHIERELQLAQKAKQSIPWTEMLS